MLVFLYILLSSALPCPLSPQRSLCALSPRAEVPVITFYIYTFHAVY